MVARRARRQYRRPPSDDRDAIDAAFAEMCEDPFSGDFKSIRGSDGLRRRVRDWRILFKLDETANVIVVTGFNRRGPTAY